MQLLKIYQNWIIKSRTFLRITGMTGIENYKTEEFSGAHSSIECVVIMRVLRWDEGIQKQHEKKVLGPEMCIALLIWFFPVLLQAGGGGKLYYFFLYSECTSVSRALRPQKTLVGGINHECWGHKAAMRRRHVSRACGRGQKRRRRAETLHRESRLLRLCLLTFLLWLLYKQKLSRSMLCSGRSFQSWLGRISAKTRKERIVSAQSSPLPWGQQIPLSSFRGPGTHVGSLRTP